MELEISVLVANDLLLFEIFYFLFFCIFIFFIFYVKSFFLFSLRYVRKVILSKVLVYLAKFETVCYGRRTGSRCFSANYKRSED